MNNLSKKTVGLFETWSR